MKLMNSNERISTLWKASTEALQVVVREHRVTEQELAIASDYFNRLGISGMFPSLLAVAFAMTSLDATRNTAGGTRQNLEGPFHVPGAPIRHDGILYEYPPAPGASLLQLEGKVRDSISGEPIPGAELDIWQADHEGVYDHEGYHLRGRLISDAQGNYRLITVVPCDYSEHDHDPIGELFRAMDRHNRRAAHIHLRASARGYSTLTTQIFMPDSAYLDSDYVEGAVSEDLTLAFEEAPKRDGHPWVKASFDVLLVPAQVDKP